MTARDPKDVKRDLIEIGKMLRAIAVEYEWAHGYAHSPTVRAGDGGKTSKDDIAHSDTTGEVVAAERKELARRLLSDLSDDVADAKSRLQRVHRLLRKRWGARGRDFMYLGDPGQIVPRTDVAEAHEAQGRRHARGEIAGESPLPREGAAGA